MIGYIQKFRLDRQTAVVCGALGLLGKEVCIALAQAGAKVIALDVNEKQGSLFQEECSKNNFLLKYMDFDVTNLDLHQEFMKTLDREEGPISVFVNAAYPRTEDWNDPLEKIKIDSWKKNVDLQMNSACLLTRDVAEIMKRNNLSGSIINFGSIYGVVAPDFEVYTDTENMTMPAAYAAIKGGILNFSRYTASY